MITLLTGENSFEIDRRLRRIIDDFGQPPEMFDGSELTVAQLPDLFMGVTLFSPQRLVVVKNLSENKAVWEVLGDWLSRISDDVHVVIVDPKPDKRTRSYKELNKQADTQEFKTWTERDILLAQNWVAEEAKKQGKDLNKKCVQLLTQRVGFDQWALWHAMEKLFVLDSITPEVIEEIIELQPAENVFNLFETALKKQTREMRSMLRTLELNEDPYMVFGLLSSQAFQLAALVVSDKSSSEIAKDIGAHPFALSKLTPHAKKHNEVTIKKIVTIFAEADDAMKTSGGSPWLLIERALVKVATI